MQIDEGNPLHLELRLGLRLRLPNTKQQREDQNGKNPTKIRSTTTGSTTSNQKLEETLTTYGKIHDAEEHDAAVRLRV